jgi:hypothetical protein
MIKSDPMDCDCKARYLVYLNPATSTYTKWASLVNDFTQETLQVRPNFLKAECYLLGTYIISLTTFRRTKDRCTWFPI